MPVLSLACHLPHNAPHIPWRYNYEQTTKQTKAINNSYIYINISCKCDTNRAGHLTLDAYASRPVACFTLDALASRPVACWPALGAGLLCCNFFGQPGSVSKFPPLLWVKLWVGWVGRGYTEISRYFPASWINWVTLVTKIKLLYSLRF